MLAMANVSTRAEPAEASDHVFEAIERQAPLAQWQGAAGGQHGLLLRVHAAVRGLQALWERYEAKGLVVIGVPSNDFGEQEPKAESEILGFCKGAFGVTFPLTTKVVVKGAQAHPFYRWAREALGAANAPSWNFHKYLVGRDGRLIAGYGSRVEPLSPELTKAIEGALAGPRPADKNI
jgi:glutathione peroxidase